MISEHSLVRTHPVTGFNSVNVNPGSIKMIFCVPKAESDAILPLLYFDLWLYIIKTVRWKWQRCDFAL